MIEFSFGIWLKVEDLCYWCGQCTWLCSRSDVCQRDFRRENKTGGWEDDQARYEGFQVEFGSTNILVAKDCLLSDQEQACSRITQMFCPASSRHWVLLYICFRNGLEEADWMDNATRRKAEEKVSQLVVPPAIRIFKIKLLFVCSTRRIRSPTWSATLSTSWTTPPSRRSTPISLPRKIPTLPTASASTKYVG